MRRTAALAAGILICATQLTGCYTYSTGTNKVVTGNLYYVYYYKHATDDVVDWLHFNRDSGNSRTTLNAMLAFGKSTTFKGRLAKVGMKIADFDYFFDRVNDDDFQDAALDVVNTQRCLVMHYNLNPLGDHHNWTYRNSDDGHCAWGQHYLG